MSFADQIAQFARNAQTEIDNSVKSIRLQAVELVAEKMPVDKGGARSSLVASLGSIDTSIGENEEVVIRARPAIYGQVDTVFYFTSSIPYIATLEYGGYGRGAGATNKTTRDGYSIQAPEGMFRKSAQELQSSVSQIIFNSVN